MKKSIIIIAFIFTISITKFVLAAGVLSKPNHEPFFEIIEDAEEEICSNDIEGKPIQAL